MEKTKKNTTVNKVIATGKCIAVSNFRNQKRVTLVCKSSRGDNVFPQFFFDEFDEKLLKKNIRVEGFVKNIPFYVDGNKTFVTALKGTNVTLCPEMSSSDFESYANADHSHRIFIYLQGPVTSERLIANWLTTTVDVGQNGKHLPIRVSMKNGMADKPIQVGETIKCVCILDTPKKTVTENGKERTVVYQNIIAAEVHHV